MRPFLIFLSLFFNHLFSQSFFAARGLGEEVSSYEAGQSSLGKNHIFSYENPTFPLDLKTTITLGSIGQQLLYAKGGEGERFLYQFQINYFKVLIPTFGRTKFGFGLRRRFAQDFDIYSDTFGSYFWHIIGKGGINALSFALAKEIRGIFAFGVGYDYIFGGSEENWSFETENGPLTQETVFGRYQGGSIRFATLGRIGQIEIGTGMELFFPIQYQGHLSVKPETAVKREIRISPVYNFGLSFPIRELKRVFFGFQFKDWAQTKLDGEVMDNLTSGFLFSLGLIDYWRERHPLRIGYAENFWSLLAKDKRRVEESSLNLGTSILIPKFGFFDLSLETFYRRGGDLKEIGLRILFSPRFDETWKRRERRWGYW